MEKLKAAGLVPRAGDQLLRGFDSVQRGGDMGLVTASRLQQAPPALRNAVVGKAPGTVNVASAGNGAFTIVLVVAREAAGQRNLTTPGLKDPNHRDAEVAPGGAPPRRLPDVAPHRRGNHELPRPPGGPGQGCGAHDLARPPRQRDRIRSLRR